MNDNFEFNGKKPEITEQYVALLRLMQGKSGDRNKTWEDVYREATDECGISRDTAKRRITELRAMDGRKPVKILGAEVKLKIGEGDEEDGVKEKLDMLNTTCHPLFLPLNITQVAVMLMGLYGVYKSPHTSEQFRIVAKKEAEYVWCQLTEYCRCCVKEYFGNSLFNFGGWLEGLSADIPLKFENDEWICIGQRNVKSLLQSIMKNHGQHYGEQEFIITCKNGKSYNVCRPRQETSAGIWSFEDAMCWDRNGKNRKTIKIDVNEIDEITWR